MDNPFDLPDPLANQAPTLTELRKFVVPEFIFGMGARSLAGRYARNFGARKVLVVTDPGVERAGWVDEILKTLTAENIPFVIFDHIHSNPREHEVMEGAALYDKEKCNLILAIGGGSPMDCAKGIGAVSANKLSVLEYEGVDQIPNPCPPLICIPTTAGTSADVSQFAIINDTARKVKIAIISKAAVPDIALIDPETTYTMDANLTAATGMDALTHAVEAYVSTANSPITDLNALEAIRLIVQNLALAVNDPQNALYRHNMMLASLYAGLAFSNASLGAVHAMAHSLGGLLDLPHGECNALLLEHVIHYNYDLAPRRYDCISRVFGQRLEALSAFERRERLVESIRLLRTSVGLNRSLKSAGVTQADIPKLAQNAIQDPCMVTNPRQPNIKDIETIYEWAL